MLSHMKGKRFRENQEVLHVAKPNLPRCLDTLRCEWSTPRLWILLKSWTLQVLQPDALTSGFECYATWMCRDLGGEMSPSHEAGLLDTSGAEPASRRLRSRSVLVLRLPSPLGKEIQSARAVMYGEALKEEAAVCLYKYARVCICQVGLAGSRGQKI